MIAWDLDLLHRINSEWTAPWLDYLMPALSAIDAWTPLLAVIVIIAAVRGGKRARLMLLCIALAAGIGDGVICKSLKSAVGRVRPRDAMSGVVIRDLAAGKPAFTRLFKAPVSKVSETPEDEHTTGKSFPSSHTANMFAVATVIALFFRGWGIVALVIAAGVAYSRVYVGAHWPSDIPPSIGIGMLIGWATVRAVSLISRQLQSRPSQSST